MSNRYKTSLCSHHAQPPKHFHKRWKSSWRATCSLMPPPRDEEPKLALWDSPMSSSQSCCSLYILGPGTKAFHSSSLAWGKTACLYGTEICAKLNFAVYPQIPEHMEKSQGWMFRLAERSEGGEQKPWRASCNLLKCIPSTWHIISWIIRKKIVTYTSFQSCSVLGGHRGWVTRF